MLSEQQFLSQKHKLTICLKLLKIISCDVYNPNIQSSFVKEGV